MWCRVVVIVGLVCLFYLFLLCVWVCSWVIPVEHSVWVGIGLGVFLDDDVRDQGNSRPKPYPNNT